MDVASALVRALAATAGARHFGRLAEGPTTRRQDETARCR